MYRKNIISFGRTGAGKSSISTMLYMRCLLNNENPFNISDSVKPSMFTCVNLSNNKYNIYDTIGLGSSSDHESRKVVRKFTRQLKVRLNVILLVKKAGRIDVLDKAVYNEAKRIFKKQIKDIALVITCDCGEWVNKERQTIIKEYGNIPIISVDIPSISPDKDTELLNAKKRLDSLIRLEEFIDKHICHNRTTSWLNRINNYIRSAN